MKKKYLQITLLLVVLITTLILPACSQETVTPAPTATTGGATATATPKTTAQPQAALYQKCILYQKSEGCIKSIFRFPFSF